MCSISELNYLNDRRARGRRGFPGVGANGTGAILHARPALPSRSGKAGAPSGQCRASPSTSVFGAGHSLMTGLWCPRRTGVIKHSWPAGWQLALASASGRPAENEPHLALCFHHLSPG
ncbi:hypothetical protein AAFF_G00063870 [Aldrovandia affinis]|uniref:Uncharacterized protein n=1 Tax=Aldrovandia affinis TaxID=143900 RepID=A0AAD7WZE7_9TELE|nr:hypothetical protein AAFF_G00063870 [Aldrovandia affinis]